MGRVVVFRATFDQKAVSIAEEKRRNNESVDEALLRLWLSTKQCEPDIDIEDVSVRVVEAHPQY